MAESAVRAPGGSSAKTEIEASIEYDTARSLPLSIDESSVVRAQRGVVAETVTTHVVVHIEP